MVPLTCSCRSNIVGPSSPDVRPYIRKTEYMASVFQKRTRCSLICCQNLMMVYVWGVRKGRTAVGQGVDGDEAANDAERGKLSGCQ